MQGLVRLILLGALCGLAFAEMSVTSFSVVPNYKVLTLNDSYNVSCAVTNVNHQDDIIILQSGESKAFRIKTSNDDQEKAEGFKHGHAFTTLSSVGSSSNVHVHILFTPLVAGQFLVKCGQSAMHFHVIEVIRNISTPNPPTVSAEFVVPKSIVSNLTNGATDVTVKVITPSTVTFDADSDVSTNCSSVSSSDAETRYCFSLKLKQSNINYAGRYRFELGSKTGTAFAAAQLDVASAKLEVSGCGSLSGSNCIADSETCAFKCKVFGWPFTGCAVQTTGPEPIQNPRMTVECLFQEQMIKVILSKPFQDDSGIYNVTAQSGTNSTLAGEGPLQIRVKDKLAPLWPFLGICAEVVILCGVILFFEKRHQKKLLQQEQEEAGASEALVKNTKGGGEVRQRAAKA